MTKENFRKYALFVIFMREHSAWRKEYIFNEFKIMLKVHFNSMCKFLEFHGIISVVSRKLENGERFDCIFISPNAMDMLVKVYVGS